MRDGAQTVLVVEDEPLVRFALIELLRDAGFEACQAGAAREAISILETTPEIGIVITDVHMPGQTNGVRLAELIRERWPTVGIMLTSGHRQPVDPVLAADIMFLRKPFRAEALLANLAHLVVR